MSFKAIKTLMNAVGTGFLATTDGKRPTVRPMSAYAWYGKELWLATGLKSVKVDDVRKKSAVEFCIMDPKTYTNVRIAGRCKLSKTPADKKKLFAAYEWMSQYFGSADDPNWAVLRLTPSRIRIMAMTDLRYKDVKI